MKRKIRGSILILLGLALAFCGAALYASYDREASLAKRNTEMLLQELNYELSQRQLNGVETETPEGQMPQILLEGQAVIGVLSVEKLGLELPIIENWDYEKLKVSPCRYLGSLEEGNLILLGHNYTSHFGRLKELDAGSEIVFFDLEEKAHTFSIAKTEILKPNQVEELESSPYPLTIFTCTPSGQSRYVVYCEKSEGTVN